MSHWVLRGLLWGGLISASVIGFDRLWCLGFDAVDWDESCAHRILPAPPLFEIGVVALVVPMALWRAARRSRGLDVRWDWTRWFDADSST